MNFQITLLNYKLDFQNKNMIFLKLKKKKASSHAQSACDEASIIYLSFNINFSNHLNLFFFPFEKQNY